MSGGHFSYEDWRIEDIADSINALIVENDCEEDEYSNHYCPKTIGRFKEAEAILRKARSMVHRIDWLVSGDDGEETFHKRWEEEELDGL